MLNDKPRFPTIVASPLAALPAPIKSAALQPVLNALFARPLADGELDFLEGRIVNVSVPDARIHFSLQASARRLRVGRASATPDLEFRGDAIAFLELASGREDSDTLFFQRRIMSSGDTELGLYVKNFLEGLERGSLPFHRAIGYTLARAYQAADTLEMLRPRFQGTLGRFRSSLSRRA
ncbi:MAG TPA: SCP2 sterol-binding domain-containing protein [Woeseiaceae bacterium]